MPDGSRARLTREKAGEPAKVYLGEQHCAQITNAKKLAGEYDITFGRVDGSGASLSVTRELTHQLAQGINTLSFGFLCCGADASSMVYNAQRIATKDGPAQTIGRVVVGITRGSPRLVVCQMNEKGSEAKLDLLLAGCYLAADLTYSSRSSRGGFSLLG